MPHAEWCSSVRCCARNQQKQVKKLGLFDKTYFVITSDHGYNLGHHRIPSNKFLLYDHATRIPMVVFGPGIKPGNNSVLGTNVDYAPTWLAMAGIATPGTMDGRSILTQIIPPENEQLLPAPTRARVRAERTELATTRPWRVAQFHQCVTSCHLPAPPFQHLIPPSSI